MTDFKKTEFEGQAGEYFRIWIVNLFLSIITLGIYSPWAKVINTKYLYQNLSIEGHRFDYCRTYSDLERSYNCSFSSNSSGCFICLFSNCVYGKFDYSFFTVPLDTKQDKFSIANDNDFKGRLWK